MLGPEVPVREYTVYNAREITHADSLVQLQHDWEELSECVGVPLDLNKFRAGRYVLADSIVRHTDGHRVAGINPGFSVWMYAVDLDNSPHIVRLILRHEMLHYKTGLNHPEIDHTVWKCNSNF